MLRGRRNEKQNRPGLSFESNLSAGIRISRAHGYNQTSGPLRVDDGHVMKPAGLLQQSAHASYRVVAEPVAEARNLTLCSRVPLLPSQTGSSKATVDWGLGLSAAAEIKT